MSDFDRAEREYERREEAKRDVADIRSSMLDDYKAENRGCALLEFIGDEQPSIELVAFLQEINEESPEWKKLFQYIKSHAERGKLNKPELAELGGAFLDLIYSTSQPYIDDELEKEFENGDF